MYYIGLDVHKRTIRTWKISRRAACQVLPLTRLGEGAQALDAPVDKFRDWQENTNSIFCSRPLAGLRQTTAERPTPAAGDQKGVRLAFVKRAKALLTRCGGARVQIIWFSVDFTCPSGGADAALSLCPIVGMSV
jgi:hypothetical protein